MGYGKQCQLCWNTMAHTCTVWLSGRGIVLLIPRRRKLGGEDCSWSRACLLKECINYVPTCQWINEGLKGFDRKYVYEGGVNKFNYFSNQIIIDDYTSKKMVSPSDWKKLDKIEFRCVNGKKGGSEWQVDPHSPRSILRRRLTNEVGRGHEEEDRSTCTNWHFYTSSCEAIEWW